MGRLRLTNYHRLLERFDGGDRAILNAIRMKVYAGIAATYHELAEECKQLADHSQM